MSAKWFDPISERWHVMPERKLVDLDKRVPFNAGASVHAKRVWDAVVATATSTAIAETDECDPSF